MSLFYVDTSAALKLLVAETHSEQFAAFDDGHPARLLGDEMDAVVTYDDRLAAAASAAGFPVTRPGARSA